MKVSSFAVSVQWGSGLHYFLQTDLTSAQQAAEVAAGARKRLKARQGKRAPKPAVHVWQRCVL